MSFLFRVLWWVTIVGPVYSLMCWIGCKIFAGIDWVLKKIWAGITYPFRKFFSLFSKGDKNFKKLMAMSREDLLKKFESDELHHGNISVNLGNMMLVYKVSWEQAVELHEKMFPHCELFPGGVRGHMLEKFKREAEAMTEPRHRNPHDMFF